jgi:hypothetical protein
MIRIIGWVSLVSGFLVSNYIGKLNESQTKGQGVTMLIMKTLHFPLVISSGFSFPAMGVFVWEGGQKEDRENDAFQNRFIETCTADYTQQEREQRLSHWE